MLYSLMHLNMLNSDTSLFYVEGDCFMIQNCVICSM